MFNLTEEYRLIKNELTALNSFDEYAIFECYADSIFTFSFTLSDIYCQINFSCDDSFSREIQISDILELKRISYFSLSVFSIEKNKAEELIKEISWSMNFKVGIN